MSTFPQTQSRIYLTHTEISDRNHVTDDTVTQLSSFEREMGGNVELREVIASLTTLQELRGRKLVALRTHRKKLSRRARAERGEHGHDVFDGVEEGEENDAPPLVTMLPPQAKWDLLTDVVRMDCALRGYADGLKFALVEPCENAFQRARDDLRQLVWLLVERDYRYNDESAS